MRTPLLTTLGLGALLLTACASGGDPAPAPTTSSATSATTSATTEATTDATADASADAQAASDEAHRALQASLSDSFSATVALLEERKVCPVTEDLACMIATTTKIADQARTDIPKLEAAAAAGGAPCLQEVARLQVEVLGLYVEQERLFATGSGPGTYPLNEITLANDAVAPLQAEQEAALATC